MSTQAKYLTMILGALVLALAPVTPAAADALVSEIYARTKTKQEADRIAENINRGRVRGWGTAFVSYDEGTRTFIVEAVRREEPHPEPTAEMSLGTQRDRLPLLT